MSRPFPTARLVFVLSLAQAPALAQEEGGAEAAYAVAQKYVELGETLFRQKQYGKAIASFTRAEETLAEADLDVPAPLYRALARSYDQLGQIVAALRYYKRFLALADAGDRRLAKAVKQARDAQERLQSVLERTRLQFTVQPDGTEVKVDTRTVGSTPLEPLRVKPGPHQITLWADGYDPMSLDLDVAAGATVPVVAKLVPRREEASNPAAEGLPANGVEPGPDADPLADGEVGGTREGQEAGSAWRPWAAGGLGAVGAGLGVTAVLLALSAADLRAEADGIAAVARTGDERAAAQARVNELYEEAGPRDNTALALGVLAVGALAGGVYLLLAGPGEGTETGAGAGPFTTGVVDAHVGPGLAPPGAQLSLRF